MKRLLSNQLYSTKVRSDSANRFYTHGVVLSHHIDRGCNSSNQQFISGLPLFERPSPFTSRCHFSTSTIKRFPLPENVRLEVRLEDFRASVTGSPAIIREELDEDGTRFVNVDYTRFKSSAKVRLPPIPEGEEWHVGYVQAVRKAFITDHYGESGTAKTIIPELLSEKYEMVADGDGTQYIWCNSKLVSKSQGPAEEQIVSVEVSDQPCSISQASNKEYITSFESGAQKACRVLNLHGLFGRKARFLPPQVELQPLTYIARNIEFCTWLVIRCANTDEYHVLTSTEWKVVLYMEYNMTKPQGRRFKFVDGDGTQDAPYTRVMNPLEIPACVFQAPCANEAFAIIWAPYNRDLPERVIDPPDWNPDYQHMS